MQISEPMTLVTDYLLALLAAWLGRDLLIQGSGSGERSRSLLGGAFLALALGAFLGGTSHGFIQQLGAAGNAILWRATMVSIGVTSFLFLAAAANAALGGGWRRGLVALAAIELVVYGWWVTARDDDFRWAIYDYVPAMLVTAVLMAVLWRRGRPSGGWIVAGIAVSFVGAGVQMSGFSLHRHFNHNDLYHVIQMGALYLLYRGGRGLRDA